MRDEAGGDDVIAAAFQDYLRQGLGRWAIEDGAVGGREHAAVAGACEYVLFGAIENRTGVVGAEAAEGDIGFCGGAEKEARPVVGRISENF